MRKEKKTNNVVVGNDNKIVNSNISGNDTNINADSKKKEYKWIWYIIVPILVSVIAGLIVWWITAGISV